MKPHSVQSELMSVIVRVRADSPLQRRPAVRDGVALQHAGQILELVAGLADSYRVEKQHPRPGRAPSPQLECSASRSEVPVDRCRAHPPNLIDCLRGRERVVEIPGLQEQRKPPGSVATKYFRHGNPISFHT